MAAALRGRRAAWEIKTGGDGPAAGDGPTPPSAPAAASRLTPAVLFITVVLAVVLIVCGLLHVLRRLFLKTHRANARAEAVERQLQQLFHLHEDGAGPGLDQAAIDALPAFAYGELGVAAGAAAKGEKPFDCAVCLCEFAGDDRLRLLPLCGHAFHVDCIDIWLRSSSTCPLCRAALSERALAAATAAAATVVELDIEEQKLEQETPEEAASSVVLPVRLGRFKNTQGGAPAAAEASSSCLDARRCYSMGSYQYVLADDTLLISVHRRDGNGSATAVGARSSNVATARGDEQHGKKVYGRGDSFSMSKIWQWRGGDRRLPGLRADASPPADDGLPPWAATSRTTCTRQESDT